MGTKGHSHHALRYTGWFFMFPGENEGNRPCGVGLNPQSHRHKTPHRINKQIRFLSCLASYSWVTYAGRSDSCAELLTPRIGTGILLCAAGLLVARISSKEDSSHPASAKMTVASPAKFASPSSIGSRWPVAERVARSPGGTQSFVHAACLTLRHPGSLARSRSRNRTHDSVGGVGS